MNRLYLPIHLAKDLVLGIRQRAGILPPTCVDDDARIQAAYTWLTETINVTGEQGSSKGFSYIFGWMPAFPETTGYLIPTLLAYHAEFPGTRAWELAIKLGEWLQTCHNEDGGIQEGTVNRSARSIAFNTGMVLQGYTALYQATGDRIFLESGRKCANFLADTQAENGSWPDDYEHIPHTYHSRVAWALLSYAKASEDDHALASGKSNLDWVLAQQRENGYWDQAYFFEKVPYANTHSLGYILEGLIESYQIVGEEKWLNSAVKVADRLLSISERKGVLNAYYNESWKEQKVVPFRFVCLTGVAQIARCWLVLQKITGDQRYLNAGMNAIDYLLQYQRNDPNPWNIYGALPGSAPIYGRYAPLQFPNWATKFLLDALLERRRALAELRETRYQLNGFREGSVR